MNAGLFGINHSNHNFSKREAWGKNIFNNAFPVSLALYMHSKNIEPTYLTLSDNLEIEHAYISVPELFGEKTEHPSELFFDIGAVFPPYREVFSGDLPGIDLVTRSSGNVKYSQMTINDSESPKPVEIGARKPLRPLEIKLTALPDNSTCNLDEDEYGCEIVVRPETIIYLACSLLYEFRNQKEELTSYFEKLLAIENWSDWSRIKNHAKNIANALDNFIEDNVSKQKPLVMQSIWKTRGKSLVLDDQCFDMFVWSDFAFTRLFWHQISSESRTRGGRSLVWLAKMIVNFIQEGSVNHRDTVKRITFDLQTDKAFSKSGKKTHGHLDSPHLKEPRVPRTALSDIILGTGQKYLSPERRLDAAIVASAELFNS